MDYPKLISEKWNLTAKFNCLEAIYIYAPSALAVPMCDCTLTLVDVGLRVNVVVSDVPAADHKRVQDNGFCPQHGGTMMSMHKVYWYGLQTCFHL